MKSRPLAVFDFDGTLIHGDSLLPFLAELAGWPKVLSVFGKALLKGLVQGGDVGARRTAIKAYMLERLLGGLEEPALTQPISRFRYWPKWKDKTVAALREHHAKGHHILIASGGLNLYLPDLLESLPYDGLLCTRMESVGGVLTGKMEGGNCVRAKKAEMLAAYMAENGPFGESWGYGNAPHDAPMMALLDHATYV